MLNRVMRSGRTYDPGQPPVVPKRRSRKSKMQKLTETLENSVTHVSETPEASGEQGKLAFPTYRGLITFGTITADESADESLVLDSTGSRKGVTWADNNGVKVSPSVYQSLTIRAPPIRRPNTRQGNEMDAHKEMDARHIDKAEARANVVACNPADALAEIEDDSPNREVPGTPVKTESGLGLRLGNVDTIYATAHTSRMTEADSDDDRSSDYDPQYVVLGESPSANRMRKKPRLSGRLVLPDSADGETQSEPEANTWYDEVLRSEGPPNRANTLPDLYIE